MTETEALREAVEEADRRGFRRGRFARLRRRVCWRGSGRVGFDDSGWGGDDGNGCGRVNARGGGLGRFDRLGCRRHGRGRTTGEHEGEQDG